MNRIELKAKAKEQIKGKIGILFVISLIIFGITGLATYLLGKIPVVGELITSIVVTPAFSLSMIMVYLNVAKGGTPKAGDSFEGFHDFWAAFKVTFLVGLFTFLWSLLFVIPGIIKMYSYSMSLYVLAENKGKKALECIDESKKMTEGFKMDLFVLGLSFIGWMLLGAITFGIAYIWVGPYMNATYTNAYLALKPQEAVAEEAPVVEIPAEVKEEPAAEETEDAAE